MDRVKFWNYHSLLRKFYILVFTILIASCSSATDDPPYEVSSLTEVSIRNHSRVKYFKAVLEELVNDRAENTPYPHHFYVSKYKTNDPIFYIYWLEKKLILIADVGGNTLESWSGIRYPSGGRIIELPKDVVESADDVGSSTYLVDKQWVKENLYKTLVLGDLFKIEL